MLKYFMKCTNSEPSHLWIHEAMKTGIIPRQNILIHSTLSYTAILNQFIPGICIIVPDSMEIKDFRKMF